MQSAQGKMKETPKKEHIFRDFGGINTQAYRTSIKDNEFSWLENVQPIGHGNLKCLQAQSAALATISPDVCNYMASANITNVDYVFLFCNSGAGYQINSTTYAVVKFAPAATFSTSGVQMTQWKNERILIIDPVNGMFTWDGLTLTKLNNQIQSITMTAFGSGYFHVPTVVFTPVSGGSGAVGKAIIGIGTISVTAGGTGYAVGDAITLSGGSFNTAAQITVASVGASNAIISIAIKTVGDYISAPSNPASSTGGFGTGATFTVAWSVIGVLITNAGSGYLVAPTISFTPTGGDTPTIAATALAAITSTPSVGNTIAVYSGRVWISSNRTVIFSAPNSYTDFTIASLGGSFIISDSTLHNKIIQLCTANNYLYIFGDDSINVVSNLTVVNGATNFSNTNLTAFVGTSLVQTVQPYLRGVFFGNQSGFYIIYGSVPQKVSDALDGIFQFIDFTKPITASSIMLNNELCMAFMFNYIGGTSPRALMAIYFNQKWFLASQGNLMTLCCSVFEDSKQEMYLTDGTFLYHAFKNTTGAINTKIQTKLWDFNNSLVTKQALKAGLEVVTPVNVFNSTLTIDTEFSSNTFTVNSQNLVNWVNNSGNTLLWQNNALLIVGWLFSGFTYLMQDVTNYGKYLGITLTSQTTGYQVNATMLEFEERARW